VDQAQITEPGKAKTKGKEEEPLPVENFKAIPPEVREAEPRKAKTCNRCGMCGMYILLDEPPAELQRSYREWAHSSGREYGNGGLKTIAQSG